MANPVTVKDLKDFLSQFEAETLVYFECVDDYYSCFPDLKKANVAPLYLREFTINCRNKKTDRVENWKATEFDDAETIDSRPSVIFSVE